MVDQVEKFTGYLRANNQIVLCDKVTIEEGIVKFKIVDKSGLTLILVIKDEEDRVDVAYLIPFGEPELSIANRIKAFLIEMFDGGQPEFLLSPADIKELPN